MIDAFAKRPLRNTALVFVKPHAVNDQVLPRAASGATAHARLALGRPRSLSSCLQLRCASVALAAVRREHCVVQLPRWAAGGRWLDSSSASSAAPG